MFDPFQNFQYKKFSPLKFHYKQNKVTHKPMIDKFKQITIIAFITKIRKIEIKFQFIYIFSPEAYKNT